VLTAYGIVALCFMMTMYALEKFGEGFVLAFSFGCVLSSIYGFLSPAPGPSAWSKPSGPS
jgi:hypothetical protein